jgi:hypothetical protein
MANDNHCYNITSSHGVCYHILYAINLTTHMQKNDSRYSYGSDLYAERDAVPGGVWHTGGGILYGELLGPQPGGGPVQRLQRLLQRPPLLAHGGRHPGMKD